MAEPANFEDEDEEETKVRTFDSGVHVAGPTYDTILIKGAQTHTLKVDELVLVFFPHPKPDCWAPPPGFYIVKVRKANMVMCTREFDVIGYPKPNHRDFRSWDFPGGVVTDIKIPDAFSWKTEINYDEFFNAPHMYENPHNSITHKAIRDRHSKPVHNNAVNQTFRQQQ